MTTFLNFAQEPVAKYASFFRNNGCLWVFHHIPKTAGSSLTRELSGTLAPYRNVFVRPSANPGADSRLDALMEEVEAFIAENETKRYMSISGHLRQPHLKRIQEAVPSARVFTFLRDPAERLISDYRYAKTPRHPPHEEFARRYPTIEAYIEDPGSNNKMWRFVRRGNRPFSEEMLDNVFRRYAFFGLVNQLDTHFQFLTALTTFPRRPVAQVNVTVGQANNVVEISPALRSRIEKANEDDYALYAAVERVLKNKLPEMRAFIEERRAYFLGEAAVGTFVPA